MSYDKNQYHTLSQSINQKLLIQKCIYDSKKLSFKPVDEFVVLIKLMISQMHHNGWTNMFCKCILIRYIKLFFVCIRERKNKNIIVIWQKRSK